VTLQPQALFGKKLLLITGKGGIGKTLVTAALGRLAAQNGLRTLLVESSSEDQLAPLFGSPPVGHNETFVAPGLSCINLKPAENFREYVTKYLGQQKLFEKIFSHRVVQSFIKTIPGFNEIIMLGRLFYSSELAPGPRYDLIVFDGFASGHFLSLMTTPDALLNSGVGGPLSYETGRVKAFLGDAAKVGVVYIGVPEELVVSECLDFLPQLRAKAPAKLVGLIMNRAASLLADGAPTGAGPATRQYLTARLSAEAKARTILRDGLRERGFADLPRWELPEVGAVPEPLTDAFAAAFLSTLGGGAP
jgi:anion-transporting  ArsA/GET3 family ATPase